MVRFSQLAQAVAGRAIPRIYNSKTAKWRAGPDFPKVDGENQSITDGPAALEINGNVIVMAGPGLFKPAVDLLRMERDQNYKDSWPPNAPQDLPYFGKFLELPTGQLLVQRFQLLSKSSLRRCLQQSLGAKSHFRA